VAKQSAGEAYDLYFYAFGDPTAIATADDPVNEGQLVTLDSSTSVDPLGGGLTYLWEQVTSEPGIILSNPGGAICTFLAPYTDMNGVTLTFMLTVTNGAGSDWTTVDVTVVNVPQGPVSVIDVIDVYVDEDSLIMVDGSQSYDQDGYSLTYLWEGGDFDAAASAITNFRTPVVENGIIDVPISLTVNNGFFSDTATLILHVRDVNSPPLADAGEAQVRDETTRVYLDGTGSGDPDGDAITPFWTVPPGIELFDSDTFTPYFDAPLVNSGGVDLVFTLVVSDGLLVSQPDEVLVHVRNASDPPNCDLAYADPGVLWPPNHKLKEISILGIEDPDQNAFEIEIISVTQDEPVNGQGDGDTGPDAFLIDGCLFLRAERSGTGNGRVYVVSFVVRDTYGEECSGTVSVSVPKSKKRQNAVDDGQTYDSTSE